MAHWPTVPLGSVVEFLDNLRKPVTATDRIAGPYPYYGANGQQGTVDGYIFDEPLLLLAEDGGHFDNPTRGIAYRISGKSWVNNHAHVLRMTPALDLNYACAALANMNVKKYITGTTRSKLTKAGAARIEIPLPPIAEQRRIAMILDQADVLMRFHRRLLADLDHLTDSEFAGVIRLHGATVPLSEVADFYGGASLQGGVHFNGQQGGFFLMKVSDMNRPGNEERITTCALWSPDPGPRAATCPAGSVVIPKRGGAIGTNKKRVTTRPTVLDPNLMGISPRPNRAATGFLFHWFKQFDLLSITSGTTVPQLNKRDLEPLSFPDVGEHEQKLFEDKRTRVESQVKLARKALEQAEELSASLRGHAFAGQL